MTPPQVITTTANSTKAYIAGFTVKKPGLKRSSSTHSPRPLDNRCIAVRFNNPKTQPRIVSSLAMDGVGASIERYFSLSMSASVRSCSALVARIIQSASVLVINAMVTMTLTMRETGRPRK